MNLTKTDFIQFLNCPKSFWLMRNKPDECPCEELSEYGQKLIKEGYEFESYVTQLIKNLPDTSSFEFQKTFETEDGLFARLDIARHNDDGSINIYEIKSSNSVKDEHIYDTAFQAAIVRRLGAKVGKIFIVHLNKDYMRQGDIEPEKMIVFADKTIKVKEQLPKIDSQINQALALLDQESIDETSCSCLYLSKSNHCSSFDYFNPDIPKPSIYNLPRISSRKLEDFVIENRFGLDDLDSDELSKLQKLVLSSHQNNKPHINLADIENFFSYLRYPLYFLDYEAYGSAIPVIDGLRPHAHLPFQFSLHVLEENGTLTHHEYLAEEIVLPIKLVEALEKYIGDYGSIIAWHKVYENSRNKDMAQLYPAKATFLNDLIDRTLDLEDIFKTGYVDIAFGGSTSIKKVLPVIVPELSYDSMDIADGTSAMDGWARMITEKDANKREKLKQDLLAYCKLDTLAMVKIFQFIEAQTNEGLSDGIGE